MSTCMIHAGLAVRYSRHPSKAGVEQLLELRSDSHLGDPGSNHRFVIFFFTFSLSGACFLAGCPRRLMSLCRMAVRRGLGKCRLHLISALPVPEPIKKFLLHEQWGLHFHCAGLFFSHCLFLESDLLKMGSFLVRFLVTILLSLLKSFQFARWISATLYPAESETDNSV